MGVNSSSTIEQAKGAPPLLTDEERCAAVKACRFVDDVVPHVPYVMNEAYVRDLLENKGIDYIVHGDDPCIVCLLYTSPSPRDKRQSRMPSSA